MKRLTIVVLWVAAALFVWSCADRNSTPTATEEDLEKLGEAVSPAGGGGGDLGTNRNFIANLSGRNEVPPNESHGRGVAKFQLNHAGDTIRYKLIVANIENVVAAHIHLGAAGINGPVVRGLYSASPGGGRIQGPIAEGQFAATDLSGPLGGSTTFALFIEKLHQDSLYVNVHTNDNVDPPGTGTGDLPGGEIRGQLKGHLLAPKPPQN